MYAQTTPEQRSDIYKDVETMLTPGFLTHPVEVGGHDFVLRSFFPSEFALLQMRVGNKIGDRNYKNWAVSMSICMVDGQLFLSDQRCIKMMFRMLQKMPKVIVDILFSILKGLLNRTRTSSGMIEAYAYEDISRMSWMKMGESFDVVSGYEGVEKLGRNTIQLLWTAINKFEDLKDSRAHYWSGVKLIAATNSPKEIQKMADREERLLLEEKNSRQEIMDLAYYEFYNYKIEKRELEKQAEQRGTRGIKTVESLEDEFKHWVIGERDFHDNVIEDQKDKIRARMQEILVQDQERRKVMSGNGGFFDPGGGNEIVAYTAEQMQSLIEQSSRSRIPGTTFIPEDTAQIQRAVYEKHLKREGILPPPKTKLRGEVSLDQQIESRMAQES